VTASAPTSPPPAGRLARLWRNWVRPFLVIAVVMFAFRGSVLDWNVVPTGSMKPTILEGDYIVVNKLAYDVRVPFLGTSLAQRGAPARGDVVVFLPPGEDQLYVKRVVGVPGDVVEMRDNRLFINGRPATYDKPAPATLARLGRADLNPDLLTQEVFAGHAHSVLRGDDDSSPHTFGPVRVPVGGYFLLGDNRDNSKDSRYFGPVPRERIMGRAVAIGASLDPWDGRRPRWERFLSALR
jgi:signal peptidase I